MWKNRRVLVTGATGLLGSHMVRELFDREAEIVIVKRDQMRDSYLESDFVSHVAYGDVEDYAFVNRVVNEYQVQTIFHLAAQTQVGVANRNPLPTLRTNIMGTVNVLEAARINGTEQVIVASSDKAYGRAPYLPYDENTPLRGEHPYDVSKSCADLIAQSYRKTFSLDMSVAITRCGNLFGPGDLNYNRLIPGTIRSLLMGEAPQIRSDGKMVRDYFYVKDAVHAYLTLAEKLEDLFCYEFNFSYGMPMNVLRMVEMIQQVMGTNLTPKILNQASNEIQEQYLDSHLAQRWLNWEPQWTMEDALRETVAWYKEVI